MCVVSWERDFVWMEGKPVSLVVLILLHIYKDLTWHNLKIEV